MAKKETKKVNEEALEEVQDAVIEEATPEFAEGVVSGCTKLNVRNKPNIKAKPLTEIPAKSKVRIELEASTDEWYKVVTEGCVQGYCMKKYITLK